MYGKLVHAAGRQHSSTAEPCLGYGFPARLQMTHVMGLNSMHAQPAARTLTVLSQPEVTRRFTGAAGCVLLLTSEPGAYAGAQLTAVQPTLCPPGSCVHQRHVHAGCQRQHGDTLAARETRD